MKFSATTIKDVVVIDPVVHEDARGFLMEAWHAVQFADAGIVATFVQDVRSRSSQGTLRGMHYQVRQAQGKLIRVTQGEIFDVSVDIRKSSPTFGKWVGEVLSADNHKQVWIPPGFAHGYLVLSDFADVDYRMTDYYAPEFGRTIVWNDGDIGIEWPIGPGAIPSLSENDRSGKMFRDADVYA